MARRPKPGTHGALLDAARDEFARVGLARARVEDIARRAGISKGAFYLHFKTKDDAFREILQRFLGALEDHARRRHEVEERLWSLLGDDPDRLPEIFEAECAEDVALLELMWRHRQIIAALDGGTRPYRELVSTFRQRMFTMIGTRISERQRSGALRADLDPALFGEIVVGAYEDLARRMAEMRVKPDLAGWARTFLLVLYEGILARPAPAARFAAGPAPRARRPRHT